MLENTNYFDQLFVFSAIGPEFPVSDYNPVAIAEYLKSRREIVIQWKDKERGRKVFDERVDAAVQNAGRIVLEQLAYYLRKPDSREKDLQGISEAVNGINSLTGYYGSSNSESYAQLAASAWNETRSNALKFYLRDLEAVATIDFDPRKTPDKFEEQRDTLDNILSGYRIRTAPVWNSVKNIAGRMYTRAAEELFPQTLEAIFQENRDKPKSSLPSILEDIKLTLDYAWTGGMDVERIREMAVQMLETAKKNKFGDHIAGYIQEGVGEKMEELGRENKGKDTILKEMYEGMEKRGRELQERARQLMTAYDLISYKIAEAMKYIELGQRQIVEEEIKPKSKNRKGFGHRLAKKLRLYLKFNIFAQIKSFKYYAIRIS